MNRSYRNTLVAALFVGVSQSALAEYTYLLDAYSLSVGDRLGEGLVVKESCVNPDDDEASCEKTKYITALPGRTGRIEYHINVAGNFDVSVNLDPNTASGGGYWGETLTVFSPDNSSISAGLIGGHNEQNAIYSVRLSCFSNNTQDTGLNRIYDSKTVPSLGYVQGYSSNDIRIGIQSGTGTCYLNNNPFVPNSDNLPSIITLQESNRSYNRVAVTGINDRDRLYEIKVRGLQTACTDVGSTNSHATLSSNLTLHIPQLTYQPISGSPMDLWADLQFVPGADGSLMWRLSNYGLNQ